MTAPYNAGDRVRVQTLIGPVAGFVWSYGPQDGTYWVIPDVDVPDMVQGCIEASQRAIEPAADDPLW